MNIPLSHLHGVNPSVELCYYCQESKGVALIGKINRFKAEKMFGKDIAKGLEGPDEDLKAPHEVTLNREPCDKCKDLMEQGIILIEVDEPKTTDMSNPYRAGGWVAVKEELIERIIKASPLREDILRKRVAYLPTDAWDALGLPRAERK